MRIRRGPATVSEGVASNTTRRSAGEGEAIRSESLLLQSQETCPDQSAVGFLRRTESVVSDSVNSSEDPHAHSFLRTCRPPRSRRHVHGQATRPLVARTSIHSRVALMCDRRVRCRHSQITVSGLVRDVSGGVIAEASVEALVADRVVAATTTGADGRYSLAVPAGVPFALRIHRIGFRRSIDGRSLDRVRDITRDIDMADWHGVGHAGGDRLARLVDRAVGRRSRCPSSSRADIEALGSTELAEVLRFVPGVSVEGHRP